VSPGETIASSRYARFSGGKGLNQSIALARAGATVVHAGKVGADGRFLRDLLNEAGVDTRFVREDPGATGHALIQVAPDGQNAIIIEGGANRCLDRGMIEQVAATLGPGDWVLVQNEVNDVDRILSIAGARGAAVAFNPAPVTAAVAEYPLDGLHTLLLNEVEATAMMQCREPEEAVERLLARHRRIRVVLTLGAKGALYADANGRIAQEAFAVAAVDTTGAGDTFIGFYLSAIAGGADPAEALRLGCRAASLCVGRKGAAASIPTLDRVRACARG